MNLTLKRKCEKVVVEYLKSIPALANENIYEAHRFGEREMPYIVVDCKRTSEHPDLVAFNTAEKNVHCNIGLVFDSDPKEEEDGTITQPTIPDFDALLYSITEAMYNLPALVDFANDIIESRKNRRLYHYRRDSRG